MGTNRLHQSLQSFWMILSLALAATLLLAACGGSTTTTTTPTATTPPTPTATPSPTPSPTPTAQAAVMKVSIVEKDEKYSFQPAMITIKTGTQVVWTNTSDAPHTVTSDNGAFTASSLIQEHQTFSMTFSKPGTYHYHCSIHPYMTATVVVTS
jgi:plastocyanin